MHFQHGEEKEYYCEVYNIEEKYYLFTKLIPSSLVGEYWMKDGEPLLTCFCKILSLSDRS